MSVFLQIDPKSYGVASTTTYSKQVTRHSELKHLKRVKLEGFTNQEDEILLAIYLRNLVAVEPLIIATSDGINLRSLVKVPLHQPMQHSGSNLETAARWSEDRKYAYKFLEVGDMDEVCPTHVRMSPQM